MPNSDILVVGAGFTGAMIAAKLAEMGAQVSVVDALPVASGATRRALGLATPMPSPAHIAATLQAVQALSQLAAQHGVMPAPCRVLHLASTARGADALRTTWLSLQDALSSAPVTASSNTSSNASNGSNASIGSIASASAKKATGQLRWETSIEVVPSGFGGGLAIDAGFTFDVDMLTAKLLQHRGVTVHAGIEVNQLEWHANANKMLAMAQGYTIRADAVVLATNAYSGLLSPYLADSVQFARGAVWTSHLLQGIAAQQRAMTGDELESELPKLPWVVDGGNLVVLPGDDDRLRIAAWQWDESRAMGQTTPNENIQHFLTQHLPGLSQHTELWQSGVTTVTRDGTPLVGKLDSEAIPGAALAPLPGRVFYAIGMGPYGLAWGPVVAEQMARLITT